MKYVARLLTFVLCFEFIIGVHGPSVIQSSVSYAESCPQGTQMNTTLKKCVSAKEVAVINQATQKCRTLTGADAKKDCYQKNAEETLSKSGAEAPKKMGAVGLGSAAAIAVPLFFLIKTMKEKGLKNCKPASLVLMYAGGAVMMVGQLASFIQHKSNLKKMDKKRKALTVAEDGTNLDKNRANATEAQSQAFELLAQNEDSLAKVAKTKFTTYITATGLFAAGAVMAVIEGMKLKAAYAQLANPQTAAAAQQTIKRLTCNTPEGPKGGQSQATKTPDAAASGQTPSANRSEVVQKGSGFLKSMAPVGVNAAISALAKPKAPEAPASAPESDTSDIQGSEDEYGCSPPATMWINGKCQAANCESKGNCEPAQKINKIKLDYQKDQGIKELLNEQIKIRAIKNIASTKDIDQLKEALAEIEALEYENYSRVSYYGEEDSLKNIQGSSLSSLTAKIISETLLLNEAHAQQVTAIPSMKTAEVKGGLGDLGQEQEVLIVGANRAAAGAAKTKVGQILSKAAYQPKGRLVTNALLGTWMGVMSAQMKKQQNISKDRAEMLRKMRDDFLSSGGIATCKPEDRNDSQRPSCYCYTANNLKNPARANSQMCKTLWASAQDNIKVCITQNYATDTNCACRTQKGPDGNNTCLRATANMNLSGLGTGTFRMLGVAAAPANDLFNGNASAGDMDTANLEANAARIKSEADKMAEKELGDSKQMENLDNSLTNATAGMSLGGEDSGSSLDGMTPQAAAQELEKELGGKNSQNITTAGSWENIGGGMDGEPEKLEFGLSQDAAAIQEIEIAEVMGKELDMGQNDISKGSDTNLFEVLSNRYQRSGMRRLFDIDGKTEADKPAQTDINK